MTHRGWSKYAIDKSKMADGRHLGKLKHRNISATDGPISTNFCRVVQTGSPERTVGRHLEKSKNRHISVTGEPILMKLGMLMQNESPKRMYYSKFAFLKNQDGGGRHLEYQLNCDISATTWPISTKFGILTRVGLSLIHI